MPYNRVNKLVKASDSSPYHVKACACVPSLKMPWKGYEDEAEAKECEERENRIRWVTEDHGEQESA